MRVKNPFLVILNPHDGDLSGPHFLYCWHIEENLVAYHCIIPIFFLGFVRIFCQSWPPCDDPGGGLLTNHVTPILMCCTDDLPLGVCRRCTYWGSGFLPDPLLGSSNHDIVPYVTIGIMELTKSIHVLVCWQLLISMLVDKIDLNLWSPETVLSVESSMVYTEYKHWFPRSSALSYPSGNYYELGLVVVDLVY